MVDKSLFDDLSKVNGYMGAVLSDYTGEVLVSDTGKVKKLDETSMRFNEDFRNIHDVTDTLGLGHTRSMDIKADNANVVMACSGADSRVHLHAFVIMEKDGSIALAKMALERLLGKAIEELAK
ncbi:MAG: hypothetical protein U9O24_10610 [Campylobacterota bacterium]|nr:hypothetical protein [Campylobacterota bacterium]